MNEYLIPANSKKSRLIFGFFKPVDLVICGISIAITLILILIVNKMDSLLLLILAIIPATFGILLVFPVPHYHNVRQLLINIINFYTGNRKYYWKGWCVRDEYSKQ